MDEVVLMKENDIVKIVFLCKHCKKPSESSVSIQETRYQIAREVLSEYDEALPTKLWDWLDQQEEE